MQSQSYHPSHSASGENGLNNPLTDEQRNTQRSMKNFDCIGLVLDDKIVYKQKEFGETHETALERTKPCSCHENPKHVPRPYILAPEGRVK
jgi:hypothetical protein